MSRILITVVVCLAGALSANAQSARVSGQVLDSRHGAIKGAEVTIRNAGTEAAFRTLTTDSGSFMLPPVPPGTYEVSAASPGFASERLTGLSLDVGESKVIELALEPASVHEVVQVVDTPPEITTDRPDRSVVFDQNFSDSIPVNIRNPLQLINFSPAVTKGDDGLSGQNSASESRTNTWRINGAKAATTDIMVDGASDAASYYNQAAGIPGIEVVQEFRILASAYAASSDARRRRHELRLEIGQQQLSRRAVRISAQQRPRFHRLQCRRGRAAHRHLPAEPVRRHAGRAGPYPENL